MTGNRHMHSQSLIDPIIQLEEVLEEELNKDMKPPEPSESSEDSFEMRR